MPSAYTEDVIPEGLYRGFWFVAAEPERDLTFCGAKSNQKPLARGIGFFVHGRLCRWAHPHTSPDGCVSLGPSRCGSQDEACRFHAGPLSCASHLAALTVAPRAVGPVGPLGFGVCLYVAFVVGAHGCAPWEQERADAIGPYGRRHPRLLVSGILVRFGRAVGALGFTYEGRGDVHPL